MRFKISPVAKPRQTRSDVWKKGPVVLRYRAFADELRQACLKADFVLGNALYLEFHIAMPKSWSKKKKALLVGKPMQARPDNDNLQKSILDALLPEDCTVWHIEAKKFWAKEGEIVIENK